jgi:Rrf2 family nitric oxide-sensitive transcriptional repressor
MQLTRFTDLGLRTMMLLAAGEAEDRRVTTRAIAVGANASENHIAKAVARLADLGMVNTQRGRAGGLGLTDAGRRTSIGWLVRRLEGDKEVIECEGSNPCPLISACRLRGALAQAKNAFYRELDRYTIGDLTSDTKLPVIPGPPLHLDLQQDRQPAERTAR